MPSMQSFPLFGHLLYIVHSNSCIGIFTHQIDAYSVVSTFIRNLQQSPDNVSASILLLPKPLKIERDGMGDADFTSPIDFHVTCSNHGHNSGFLNC